MRNLVACMRGPRHEQAWNLTLKCIECSMGTEKFTLKKGLTDWFGPFEIQFFGDFSTGSIFGRVWGPLPCTIVCKPSRNDFSMKLTWISYKANLKIQFVMILDPCDH